MLTVTLMLLAGASSPATCDSLRTLSTPQVTVTAAETVPAGVFVPPPAPGAATAATQHPEPIPQHCRVKLTLKPSSDSNIYSELWMPADGWNGKLLVVGNGGFAGSIQGYGDMQVALRLGYATAATDTGHNTADGPNGMFALGHPEKIVDFAYRALHETTVESKRLIRTFYNRTPQTRTTRAARPAGARASWRPRASPTITTASSPARSPTATSTCTRPARRARSSLRVIRTWLSPEKAQIVTDAVMNKCDTLHEGFLNNPQQCTFDFSKFLCKGAESNECLTQPQLKAVEMFYGGVKNSRGEVIFAGQVLGNPLTPQRSSQTVNVSDTVRIWAFQNADYDWRTFDIDRDMPVIDQKIGFVDATDPDLKKFKAHGGKLLLYAGWGDTGITPKNTVEYYESVVNKMGKAETNDFARLFMVPGMGHCRGGNGPDTFDTIGTLETWREKGTTPAAIAATNKTSGLSRPLCPYPHTAKYKGTGDLKDSANWACTAP